MSATILQTDKADRSRWRVVALILVILLCASIRWRLRDIPLERDEGEYAYAGQLMLQGVPPYQIAYNMKLPGTYVAYAAMMAVFGQTAAGIRIGLLAVNAITILLVYAMGRRLYSAQAGVVAAASYGVLSLEPWVNGFAAHAEHFVMLAATGGLLLLLLAMDKQCEWQTFFAGLLIGLAFVMKQPGAAFGIFGLLYVFRSGIRAQWKSAILIRHVGSFVFGAILPFAITCFVLWRAGVFAKFWFWTVGYAYQYGTTTSASQDWHFFVDNFSKIFRSALGLWILAAIGLISFAWSRRSRASSSFILGFLVFSTLAVSAGLYFRGHYFIMLLPALCLRIGSAVASEESPDSTRGRMISRLSLVIFAATFAFTLFHQRYFFLQADPVAASRYVYPYDPFPEAVEVSRYIEQHSQPADRIAVLGSEPQIMFYARRRAVTGYLYAYSLTEEQKYAPIMQRDEISEIEAGQPSFIVFAQDWVTLPHSDLTILHWANRYLSENYDLVGVMRVNDGLQWRTSSELSRRPGNMTGALLLFRRKAS